MQAHNKNSSAHVVARPRAQCCQIVTTLLYDLIGQLFDGLRGVVSFGEDAQRLPLLYKLLVEVRLPHLLRCCEAGSL